MRSSSSLPARISAWARSSSSLPVRISAWALLELVPARPDLGLGAFVLRPQVLQLALELARPRPRRGGAAAEEQTQDDARQQDRSHHQPVHADHLHHCPPRDAHQSYRESNSPAEVRPPASSRCCGARKAAALSAAGGLHVTGEADQFVAMPLPIPGIGLPSAWAGGSIPRRWEMVGATSMARTGGRTAAAPTPRPTARKIPLISG